MENNYIALVGMAGRFPGAPHVDSLWDLLHEGKTAYGTVPEESLQNSMHRHLCKDPNYVRVALTIDEYQCFDAAFFGYCPYEAAFIDPQQRLLLECAWHVHDSAGRVPGDDGGSRTAVFASVGPNSYATYHTTPYVLRGEADMLMALINSEKDYAATRIAYRLGLKGPAINVQTACSSSLVGVHLACQSLLTYEADTALVTSCSLPLPAGLGYVYTPQSILARDGLCRPFDAQSSGTVFGPSVAGVLLRRYTDAVHDYDPILGIIRGSAVSNDGSLRLGFTAPSVEGQIRVIREALKMADIEPSEVGYVECHGTGTPLGDPVEISALQQAFEQHSGKLPLNTCPIGSLKSHVGHLDTVSGLAGLIKAALMISNDYIPAMATFSSPHPSLSLEKTPFRINTRGEPWGREGSQRIAGVSSFGLGGTNAHVILSGIPENIKTNATRKPLPLRSFRRDIHWLPSAYDALIQGVQKMHSEESILTSLPTHEPSLQEGPEMVSNSTHNSPQTPLEHQLAALFEQALQIHPIGRHDDFLNLGGHSLLSIDVAHKAQLQGLALESMDIIEHGTIAALATYLERKSSCNTNCFKIKTPSSDVFQNISKSTASWFPYVTRQKNPRLRLFCFPFAGGGAEFYRTWASHLPKHVEIWPIQLPGRPSRIAEKPFDDLKPLIHHLTAVFTPLLNGPPFAFFGHSMGALLAFELAHALPIPPQMLVLSGRTAPQYPLPPWKHTLTNGELIQELRTFGGTPQEILDNQEILELVLPILRCDLKLLDTYVFNENRPLLNIPMIISCGNADPLVPLESLEGWKHVTKREAKIDIWEGDHFYLQKNCSDYLRSLTEWIAQTHILQDMAS